MTKQRSKKAKDSLQPTQVAENFLNELGTNPETLAKFITDPESLMKERKIPEEERAFIRRCLALEIAKKLVVCPDAYHVHMSPYPDKS